MKASFFSIWHSLLRTSSEEMTLKRSGDDTCAVSVDNSTSVTQFSPRFCSAISEAMLLRKDVY